MWRKAKSAKEFPRFCCFVPFFRSSVIVLMMSFLRFCNWRNFVENYVFFVSFACGKLLQWKGKWTLSLPYFHFHQSGGIHGHSSKISHSYITNALHLNNKSILPYTSYKTHRWSPAHRCGINFFHSSQSINQSCIE